MRRLMHYGQILQSHALHFFHLSSPDLLFGFDAEPAQRNIVGVARPTPTSPSQGVLLRKFGQEVIRVTAGKRVHGTGSVPGGVNALTAADATRCARDADQMVAWARTRWQLVKQLHAQQPRAVRPLRRLPLQHAVAGAADGAMELYDGVHLRVRDADGRIAARRSTTSATSS
jgi:NAD-reducing hydrogenase large subunit